MFQLTEKDKVKDKVQSVIVGNLTEESKFYYLNTDLFYDHVLVLFFSI